MLFKSKLLALSCVGLTVGGVAATSSLLYSSKNKSSIAKNQISNSDYKIDVVVDGSDP